MLFRSTAFQSSERLCAVCPGRVQCVGNLLVARNASGKKADEVFCESAFRVAHLLDIDDLSTPKYLAILVLSPLRNNLALNAD